MEELPLWASARADDPETSHEAAGQLTDRRLTVLEGGVLLALWRWGDGQAEEVAERMGEDLQSVTPRFRPLERRKLVRLTGERRAGSTTRKRQVWEITEAGAELAAILERNRHAQQP